MTFVLSLFLSALRLNHPVKEERGITNQDLNRQRRRKLCQEGKGERKRKSRGWKKQKGEGRKEKLFLCGKERKDLMDRLLFAVASPSCLPSLPRFLRGTAIERAKVLC